MGVRRSLVRLGHLGAKRDSAVRVLDASIQLSGYPPKRGGSTASASPMTSEQFLGAALARAVGSIETPAHDCGGRGERLRRAPQRTAARDAVTTPLLARPFLDSISGPRGGTPFGRSTARHRTRAAVESDHSPAEFASAALGVLALPGHSRSLPFACLRSGPHGDGARHPHSRRTPARAFRAARPRA